MVKKWWSNSKNKLVLYLFDFCDFTCFMVEYGSPVTSGPYTSKIVKLLWQKFFFVMCDSV